MTRKWGAVVEGVKESRAGILKHRDVALGDFRRGVRRWLEEVAEASQLEVPRITGHLARSLRVELKDALGGRSVKGEISYNAPYAAVVHEVPRPETSNGKWKYLQDPFNERLPDLRRTIAKEVE